ncbi:L-threonylcarbamoyladenylate synthase [Paenibacillus sp.]|uniref:L-threonylcarbamoyladenylate synthase n=1 Tax=Paenibacillus sp. TaxID=58172 RepID=UPI002D327CFA|nr:L-threonylcarbamoyladenylate synthase [Paenibacillus sp.]HZG55973.1 L-threonylcarbamoyladenylate synthase [Paenibacillus sp.]
MSGIRTKLWRIEQHRDATGLREQLLEASARLRAGGLVAFPTETVYGLGADARNADAVERIFAAKGRPSDNPLIVHVASIAAAEALANEIGPVERRLMETFWPGPLTVVLPVRPGAVSPRVTAGLDTVAVRLPAHDIARELIALADVPVAAPSANRSGRPSPTLAEHVREDLNGRIDGIVDGGAADVGLESTVAMVDPDGAVRVLRPGGVSAEALAAAGFDVAPADADDAAAEDAGAAPRSPGVKYTHYAPKGRLCVVEGAPEAVRASIQARLDADAAEGARTAVLAFAPAPPGAADAYRGAHKLIALADAPGDAATAANRLYAALRACDAARIERLYAEGLVEPTGLGRAFLNRLRKAAGHRIVTV